MTGDVVPQIDIAWNDMYPHDDGAAWAQVRVNGVVVADGIHRDLARRLASKLSTALPRAVARQVGARHESDVDRDVAAAHRQFAYRLQQRSDNTLMSRDGSGQERVATLRQVADELIAEANELDPPTD